MASLSPDGKRALDHFIKEVTSNPKFPAVVLGVSNLDEEIYFGGGGKTVVDDPTSPDVTPDNVFWICSQTKMIVHLAALKLIETGKLTLDTPVSTLLPYLANPIIVKRTSTQDTPYHPAQNQMRVKHLLNFTSGLFYPVMRDDVWALHEGYWSKDMHAASDPVGAFFDVIKGILPAVPLKFEPGTNFAYGWSSDVLGFVVEKASGQTLEEFCNEHIFTPLGMHASFYLTPDMRKKLVALSYRNDDGSLSTKSNKIKIIENDPDKVRLRLGGIGLYTSPRDYLKLLRHLMQIHAGRPVANPILTKPSVDSLFEPALDEKGGKSLSSFLMIDEKQNWSTALALNMEDRPTGRKKGSAYWAGWAGTEYFMDPSSGIAVVFGTQIALDSDPSTIQIFPKLEKMVYESLEKGGQKL